MPKRKLNKQQRLRIADNRAAVAETDNGELLSGLVVTHFGKAVEVVALDGDGDHGDDSGLNDVRQHSEQAVRCHFRANLPTIVCGDRVLWRAADNVDDSGVIESLLPRRSLLQRPRPYQDPKPVAANIDHIFIVIAAQPAPIARLIDRYLIAAENADIGVSLLLNKTDLLTEAGDTEEIDELLTLYDALGYNIYRHSLHSEATQRHGEALALALTGKTSILVGQSGVGKSSIINAFSGDESAQVGDISSANDKGRHTTTTAQLYTLETASGGASVIDSPGIREFGLWHLSAEEIIYGLREFRRAATKCKFRDCQHGQSAGCAIQAAYDCGTIHPSRMSSYRQILDSLDN